jgi:FAD/FMN-containing dehydrogenase/Fe-S oxidoreductase
MTPLPVLRNSPSVRDTVRDDLTRLGVGQVRFDRHDRLLYSTDASLYQAEPLGVVVPETVEQAERVVTYCGSHKIPVLCRGGGTSLAGQCVATGAVVIDLSAFCRELIDTDVNSRTCRVQPGISVDELNRSLLPHHLFFPADPATVAQATIGGCIGNNAAGSRSIRYGRTSENLAAVEMLLSTGERVTLGPRAGRHNAVALRLAERVADIVGSVAGLIRERFPKTIRRNAGYGLDLILEQLDRGIAPADLDLSGLICGSEGTLGLVTQATLKLKPLPLGRALSVVSFASVQQAVEAVCEILKTGPSAVELLDDVVLDAGRNNAVCRQYVDLLPRATAGGDPAAVLYVEYQAEESLDELDTKLDKLARLVSPGSFFTYRNSASMNEVWMLRKSSEALLHGLASKRKPVTFVEDNAVPVENLPHFIQEFRRIVTEHGTTAAYYAHASVGVLHVRPMLDLHDQADLNRLRSISVQVAELARQCGGVMSGEHGDGRARGPLLLQFFGPELMGAFADVKRAFDPAGIFNPQSITGSGSIDSITQNLRVQAGQVERQLDGIDTYFDYTDQAGFDEAVERCNGAGFCRKTAGGTMCPSYRATLDERHSTRGRGNALRLAITGQTNASHTIAWDDAEAIKTLDLCLSCKACKTECPSNVDIARLKAEYTAQRYRKFGTPLAARVFGHVRLLNRLGSIAPTIANAVAGSAPMRSVLNRLLNIDARRKLPPFGRSLYRGRKRRSTDTARPKVVLYADCFTTYNETQLGQATISVLESLGYAVLLPSIGCCGRAMISTGLLGDAIAATDSALSTLAPFVDDPDVKAILVCEPSCLSAIKDDWLQLKLSHDLSFRRRLAAKSMLPEQFVEAEWDRHPARPAFSPPAGPLILHGHCHQKALWGDETSAALLRRLAGPENVTVLPSGCCGMAGSFGYAKDKFDLSMKIGELSLFPPLRNAPPETTVIAPGTSCRHQIKDATGRRALHPIEWAASVLGSR